MLIQMDYGIYLLVFQFRRHELLQCKYAELHGGPQGPTILIVDKSGSMTLRARLTNRDLLESTEMAGILKRLFVVDQSCCCPIFFEIVD